MPDMDKVPDDLEAAVAKIAAAVRGALADVYRDGLRDGLSVGSRYVAGLGDQLRQRPDADTLHDLIEVFDQARDHLSLGAHNVPREESGT
jgi:hypothetical protein